MNKIIEVVSRRNEVCVLLRDEESTAYKVYREIICHGRVARSCFPVHFMTIFGRPTIVMTKNAQLHTWDNPVFNGMLIEDPEDYEDIGLEGLTGKALHAFEQACIARLKLTMFRQELALEEYCDKLADFCQMRHKEVRSR